MNDHIKIKYHEVIFTKLKKITGRDIMIASVLFCTL